LRASTALTSLLLAGIVAVAPVGSARAATLWVGSTSSDYGTSANWSPADVPDSLGETAEFGNSTRTTISETGGKTMDAFQFDAGAPSYTVNLDPGNADFTLGGVGIVNNSGLIQTINVLSPGLALENSALLGDGNVVVNLIGTGQLNFNDTSTGGLATVNLNTSGGILIGGDNHSLSLGALNGTSGVVQFSGANQSLTIGGNNLSTTFAGQITGAGSLTKVGVGTLTLSGSNSYSGGTTISDGTIWAANANALGTGDVTLGDGYLRATVDFTVPGSTFTFQDGSTSTVGAAAGKTLTIAPPGGISVSTGTDYARAIHFGATNSTGTVVLGQQAPGGLGKPHFFVDAGTLKFTATWSTGGFLQSEGLTVASGATLDMNGTDLGPWELSGGGTITNDAAGTTADIGVSGSFSGSFKDGAGTVSLTDPLFGGLTLSGTNTYSGTTTIYTELIGGAPYAFSAASAVIVNGGTLNLGGFHQTIGSLSGSGTVTNSGAVAAILTTNGDNSSTTFSGLIEDGTGGIALVKDGTGTLTLSGANTYSLGTTINAGVLAADNGGALGASFVKFAGDSTLALGFNGTLANSIDVTAGASATIADGANDVTLAGQMAYLGGAGTTLHFGEAGDTGVFTLSPSFFVSDPNGKWSLDGGTLVIGDSNAAGLLGSISASNLAGGTTLDLDGHSLELRGPTGSGTILNNGGTSATVTLNGASTFGGAINDGGQPVSVWKSGGGTVTTLSGASGYSGITNILGGTLALSGAGSIVGSIGVNVNAGATFDISQVTTGASVTTLGGNGDVALGSKTLTVTNAQPSFAGVIAGAGGKVTVSGGLLWLSGPNTYTGLTTVAAGATLHLDGSGEIAGDVRNDGTFDNFGMVSGGLTNTGGGTATNAGTINGGLMNFGTGFTPSTYTQTAGSTNGGTTNTWQVNANGGAFNGAIANNAGTFAVGGAVTANSTFFNEGGAILNVTGGDFTGVTTLTNDGAVLIATGRTMTVLGLTGTQAFATIGTTGTGAFAFGGDNADRTYAGVFTSDGTVAKGGTGTETLTGTNGFIPGTDFTGAFDIDGGTLQVDGTLGDTAGNAATVNVNSGATLGGGGTVAGNVNVFSDGTLAAGASPGTLTISGNLVLNAGSTADFELGQAGVPGGANNDLVVVNGNATLDGTVNLTSATGGQVQSGYYNLMQVNGTVSGSFATVDAGTATADVYTTTGGGPFNVNALVANAGQSVQFWDGTDETGGASGLAGGSGAWNSTRTNWTTNPLGSDPLNPAGATVNDRWREGVGVFAIGGGTVTTAGILDFQGLQFIVDGYALNGPGTLNMTGDAPGGTPNASFINVESAGNVATVNAAITGNAGVGLSKAGAGTLVLGGANTYDGGTTVTAGTLALSDAGTLGAVTASTTVDGASAVLDLGGTTQTQDKVSLADGTIRNGTIEATTRFDQSGGTMSATSTTQIYTFTGGAMAGQVTTLIAYDQSGGETSGTVNAASYNLSGGTLSGTANSGSVGLTGTGIVDASGRIAVAAGGAVMQNGAGTAMAGTVTGAGGAGSAPLYTLTDGTMSGTVNATAYDQSGGTTSGTVNAVTINQSGGAVAAGAAVNGATYDLSGGSLASGATANVTTFNQTDGTMAGAANVGTYSFAGGTLSGIATATTLFDLRNGLVSGQLAGAGKLVKSGAGTVTLSGANSYGGGTTVAGGTLVGDAASIRGDIANDATVLFSQVTDAAFGGNIDGSGSMEKDGAGTLTLAGASTLDWHVLAGGLTSVADRFSGDVDIGSGASFTFDQTGGGTYAGTLSGTGSFTKTGGGVLAYDGHSSGFAGNTTVADGVLIVGSDVSHADAALGGSMDVMSGAILGGHGTVGSGAGSVVTIEDGATIAPGNSVGTLTVDGDIALAAGSTYEVEVLPGTTTSDLIHATGKALLGGGSVLHIGEAGGYKPSATYTILTADAGVTGKFDDVHSNFVFLDPTLAYSADSVSLKLVRNDVDFGAAGHTRNQRSTGNGVDSLGNGNPVWNAVAVLSGDSVPAAFDSLSGEVHASVKSMLLDDSRFVRDAATDRVRSAFGDLSAPSMPVMAYGDGGFAAAPADTDHLAVWMRGFGSWGEWKSDGNAAGLDRTIGGVLIGADGLVTEKLRLGLIAGYSHSSFDVDGRASSGSSEDYHLGFYGGSQWGAFGLRFGAAYSWHDIETARSVAFPGFAESLDADYDAATMQAFGELGYRIDTRSASFEPFAGLAYVNLHTDGYTEKGGASALESASSNTDATFTTVGIRASTDFMLGGTNVKVRGMIGWRHAFGDTTPLSRVSFGGGDVFAIAGVPIAKDAAVIEAGLDFDITGNATLGLAYSGQIGNGGAQDHGFRANFRVNF
jgi:outer membrane autotransporter protein